MSAARRRGQGVTPAPAAEPQTWVGRALPRLEDPALVRGWGRYVADIASRDNCLYAHFVRSPVASGRIVSVRGPVGARVFTAADLHGIKPIAPVLTRPDYVTVQTPILASDVVRFCGEPVAVVLAPTQAEAEDLAEEVVLDIEPLPPVMSAAAAVAPGARHVHDVSFPTDPNVVVDGRMTTDGYAAAVESAAHVIDITVSSGRQSASPMEVRAAHVAVDRSTGRLTLSATTQMPHVVRTGIADCLGLDEDLLRVVAPDVGGAFGAKMALAREDVLLVHLARTLGRNIAWLETREENLLASWHSREQVYDVRGAFDQEGRLLALGADVVADVGAYSCYPITYGVEPLMAFGELTGPYQVGEYSVRARAVLTNKCPIAPYRGVSRPVQTLAAERLMDVAADRLGMDPVAIRMVNLIDTFPHVTPTGMVIDESSHKEALALAAETVDRDGFLARQAEAREQGRYLGLGFSSFAERTGYGTPAFAARSMEITLGYENVVLGMDPSGGVTVRVGTSPHGQGLRTSLAQLVADELGLEPSKVRVIHSDTDTTPYGWGSFGSRSMVMSGGAAKIASGELRTKLTRIAADVLECSPDDVELRDGAAWVRGVDVQVSLADLARRAYHSAHRLPEGESPSLEVTATYDPGGTFSNACHVAEVEVDVETGQVEIRRFVVVEDAGVLVNPAIVDGQVHGGVVQGLANALYEELVYDESGTLLTTSFMDFLPPTIAEVPRIEIRHLATMSDQTLTGAKGVGEGGAIGAPAAVVNAVCDALRPFGIELFHMPVTPHQIRAAVRAATKGATVQAAPPNASTGVTS